MKVIAHESGISTVANHTDSGFPVANIADDYPKRQWKFTGASATLTVTPGQSSSLSTVALYNVGCSAITITENGQSPESLTILTTSTGQKSVWHEFSHPSNNAFVLTFTGAYGTFISSCGVLKYGDRVEVKNPKYGMTESYIDYSLFKELSNGSFYIKEKDIVRTFSGQFSTARTAACYYTFMDNIARTLGHKPAAWLITDLDDQYWHVFARFGSPVAGTHEDFDNSLVAFDLIEVL